ncbi:MAG: hypothetical protein A2741_01060 [Candidatus Zambryskibacteria bacterium RIFCSPHIGHO2_01_FULL_43_27]|uniref:LysM domain-containing protein n=1 Tax=Candidatus Zambryskibacteria bacterium RIFCSPLOWO2_01_FULL_43_17 TaxID=1802760 RepID=A0A1G2U554_9BACT|nr:MAG: hypothetical protein A2741_01060 [Candidatus Zambryskibacteria bacterium RIFCSPHIGHO2_01_FULL_43_27]OHB00090.1 MAG: hypothetical protein A3E93_02055 [Candidatus Zambryskibacteria bacterium RIFCSPHIGHO2_12_FULL_43_12b]OHB04621.1 MAG: hypothetical protein A2920_01640 [Candidatus Zambryskibacteria bacterium RIFCSPLOWO2_01_FULL_43_17]
MVTLLVFGIPLGVSAGLLSFISSFFSPARAEETSVENSQTMPLLQANINFDPNPNLGGGDITIVGGTALLSEDGPNGGLAENKKEHSTSDQISIYVVREGDTLSTIARMFGVSINTIRWNNEIKGSVISPGQTLVILPVSGVRHTVKKGDTLQSITKLYKGDLDEVMKYNNITSNTKLTIGDIVIIPDGEIVAQTSSGVRTQAISSTKEYVGYYLRPVAGRKSQGIHGYNGIDIAAPAGTPIYASAAGTVIVSRSSGWNGGYGNYVVIQHTNGTQTLYAHMLGVNVSQGDVVTQGQVIGSVGRTGKATGMHLHFEIRGAKNPF